MVGNSVKPSSSRWELLLLVAGVVVLVVATGIYVALNGRDDDQAELLSWQVSSFYDLNEIDQAVYSAVSGLSEEIQYVQYELDRWPTPEDLEEWLIPPVVKDAAWRRNGELEWHLKDVAQEGEKTGYTLYLGNHGKVPGQSSFLLVVGHLHAGNSQANHNTIWVHQDTNVAMPEISKAESLVREGWRMVVGYSGRDEVERLKGDQW